jgi:predicted XRE-type DNA-binding protein
MRRAIEVEQGSGNAVADLGRANPEARFAKAGLTFRIAAVIRERRVTQARAARNLRIDQPKISRWMRGQLSGYSNE